MWYNKKPTNLEKICFKAFLFQSLKEYSKLNSSTSSMIEREFYAQFRENVSVLITNEDDGKFIYVFFNPDEYDNVYLTGPIRIKLGHKFCTNIDMGLLEAQEKETMCYLLEKSSGK